MILKLRDILGERVLENETLAKHVNFRIGGLARYFWEARTSDEIVKAVETAQELGVPFFILGGGSNVLVSDAGFDGLVIKAANRSYVIPSEVEGSHFEMRSLHSLCSVEMTEGLRFGQNDMGGEILHSAQNDRKVVVRAEAGVLSAFLARKTAEAGLAGFEWAISLPGTVGGAVRGNAGCFGGEMKDVVSRVHIFIQKNLVDNSRELSTKDTGKIMLKNQECLFGYRDSIFKHTNPAPVILSVELALRPDEPAACVRRQKATLALRTEKQPLESSSAGCLFKNFEFQDRKELEILERKITIPDEFVEKHRIPASWLIDRCGFKGTRIGDVMISARHANFVLNLGHATARDVVQLASLVKMKVRDEFGIELHEEVQMVGF